MATTLMVNRFPVSFPPKKLTRYIHDNWVCAQSLSLANTHSSSHLPKKRRVPSLYLSTNPLDINLEELRDLLRATHQNCHQFPEVLEDGSVKPVDPKKLRTALLNSSVVVTAHTGESTYEWLENFFHGRRPEKFLVGFGRATSDNSLTASIHDLAVNPSLQRLGIGRKILQRIIRILTNRGIDDISALCSEEQRSFFQACGFSNDVLNSTTMFYCRTPTYCKEGECIKYFGQKPLLVPGPLTPYSLKSHVG